MEILLTSTMLLFSTIHEFQYGTINHQNQFLKTGLVDYIGVQQTPIESLNFLHKSTLEL